MAEQPAWMLNRRSNIIAPNPLLRMERERLPIVTEVDRYLAETEGKYQPHHLEFGARLALSSARRALVGTDTGSNYGIGAAVMVVQDGVAAIFEGANTMITGTPEQRLTGHAETNGLKGVMAYMAGDESKGPVQVVKMDVMKLPFDMGKSRSGIIMAGTLEPCPMCECVTTNAAPLVREALGPDAVIRSYSSAIDGFLDGALNNGAAHALGAKSSNSPLVWQSIQRGYFPGQAKPEVAPVEFSLLQTTSKPLQGHAPHGMFYQTEDRDLERLASEIFVQTRQQVDAFLAGTQQ